MFPLPARVPGLAFEPACVGLPHELREALPTALENVGFDAYPAYLPPFLAERRKGSPRDHRPVRRPTVACGSHKQPRGAGPYWVSTGCPVTHPTAAQTATPMSRTAAAISSRVFHRFSRTAAMGRPKAGSNGAPRTITGPCRANEFTPAPSIRPIQDFDRAGFDVVDRADDPERFGIYSAADRDRPLRHLHNVPPMKPEGTVRIGSGAEPDRAGPHAIEAAGSADRASP